MKSPKRGAASAAPLIFLSFLLAVGCYKSGERACGDGVCGTGETCSSCAADCGPCPSGCGDGVCDTGETCSSCAADCGPCPSVCGDGLCGSGETCASCSPDCGRCPICGDGVCEGETCSLCPADCGFCPDCGDGVCGEGEGCSNCPADCGPCPSGCGDRLCLGDETCGTCPADCGPCLYCGDGYCSGSETCETCGADCGRCTDDASVSFRWTIHHVPGGESVSWGAGEASEVCELAAMLTESPGVTVQLWVETTGDDVADLSFDFECAAGSGHTTPAWEAGSSLTYAFALLDGYGTLLSQSASWQHTTLRGGVNDLGVVNFYLGDYGPLEVDLQWADKVMGPAFGDCSFPPDSVSVMGYLLCWGPLTSSGCPYGNLYDEVDIDLHPVSCRSMLVWDITDFGVYTLVVDGEDAAGVTIWGMECRDLVVDSMAPASNRFICQVLMTGSP